MQDSSQAEKKRSWWNLIFLLLLWLVINVGDRLWISLDHSIPGWDESNHLTGSLNYLASLLNFPGWEPFWQVSTKYPPLTYLLAALFQLPFGKGNDQALLINLIFTAVLIWSVYSIGKRLFNPEVGRWSAAIALLMPRFFSGRLGFITDFPLTTVTVLSFTCLTYWYFAETRREQWVWITGFGCSLGLALMTKQTCMFFLFLPLLWSALSSLWQKKWEKILQLAASVVISLPFWWGWYRTNYIYLFSTYQVSNSISPTNEGDPALNSLDAWIYYWRDLPQAVSWIWLLVPLVGIALHLLKRLPSRKIAYALPEKESFIWLGVYFGGAYLLFSALYNKDTRYVMPYLPVLAVFLGYGLTQWRSKWVGIRWGALGCAILLWLVQLFPLPLTRGLALGQHYFDPNQYPHEEVIAEVLRNTPYLRSNIGVIPSLVWLNHNNINYVGALENFQVYGRELGGRPEDVAQDEQGFDWFITKTKKNGRTKKPQLDLAKRLRQNSEFYVQRTWDLPDQSRLSLFHRRQPLVTVAHVDRKTQPVRLDFVDLANEAIAGEPLAVTYRWSGVWQDFQRGMVLLTWRQENGEHFWIQDHGFAFGTLHAGQLKAGEAGDRFGLVERTATLPPRGLPAGTYRLEATYLNPDTGQTIPVAHDEVTLKLLAAEPAQNEAIDPLQFVQLDWLTQLRTLAAKLPEGMDGLDYVFAQVERLNQYDPIQHYLQQVEATLGYRLDHSDEMQANQQQLKDWYYAKVLAHALQEESRETLATLQKLQEFDGDNPYLHAYIAFVYLYRWQPKQAERAIRPALERLPNVPEFQAIDGIAALLQGKVIKAWSVVQTLKQQEVL